MGKNEIVQLSSFAGGTVDDQFNKEMQKAIDNIADPNTDPEKARKVILEVTLKGNKKRDVATASVKASSKLVHATEVETSILMGRDESGKVVGNELKSGTPGQMYHDFDAQGNATLKTDIGKDPFEGEQQSVSGPIDIRAKKQAGGE